MVPYTLDANDMRFATPQGFNSGQQFFDYLKDTFDVLYAEGIAGKARIMNIGLHCRLAGRPGRLQAVQSFIDYAAQKTGVWFASRLSIAECWQAAYPYQPVYRPSQMSKKTLFQHLGLFLNIPLGLLNRLMTRK